MKRPHTEGTAGTRGTTGGHRCPPVPPALPAGSGLRSSHNTPTPPCPTLSLCPAPKWRRPLRAGAARALGGAALPGRACAGARARLHFRLPAAASGPQFLGNNGAENGGLSGQGAARHRRSGTGGARTGGTQPRAARAAAHPQPRGSGGGER